MVNRRDWGCALLTKAHSTPPELLGTQISFTDRRSTSRLHSLPPGPHQCNYIRDRIVRGRRESGRNMLQRIYFPLKTRIENVPTPCWAWIFPSLQGWWYFSALSWMQLDVVWCSLGINRVVTLNSRSAGAKTRGSMHRPTRSMRVTVLFTRFAVVINLLPIGLTMDLPLQPHRFLSPK